MNLHGIAPGQIYRRGRRQVQVLAIIEPQSLAPRVKLEHWNSDGRISFRLLATFVREYVLDRNAGKRRGAA